jgi:NitT/TauT family transport system ATP-binding protein
MMPDSTRVAADAGTPGAAPYIEVDHLYLGYPGKRRSEAVIACRDLNFTIEAGEFVVLVGPSGCGKTTLLESMAGLAQAGAGQLRIGGRPVTGPGRDRALVLQSPSLFPWRDVYGNVTFGAQAQGRLDNATKERARAVIDMVGLGDVAHRHPQELSGGMKQRVNLARALVTEPRLLLLDEPFGALDAMTREVMQDELVRIWQDSVMGRSTTAVFVTHDVAEAVLLADRVLVFSRSPGRIIEDIRIELPRPRASELRRSPEFTRYEEQILAALYGKRMEPAAADTAAGPARPPGTLENEAV